MGTFFSNCQVQSDSQEAVVKALTQLLKEPAYVSSPVGGWVGVYPEGTRTDLDKLAKQLSKQLSCGIFSWNVHDDDIFYYTLFEDGKRRDEFNSIPDYFEPVSKAEKNRLRGKPEALVQYCLPGIGSSKVLEVLHPPSRAESELAAEASAPLPHDITAIKNGWWSRRQSETTKLPADRPAAWLNFSVWTGSCRLSVTVTSNAERRPLRMESLFSFRRKCFRPKTEDRSYGNCLWWQKR